MTAEQNLLLHIVRLSMQGQTLQQLPEEALQIQWDSFLMEARYQGVLLGVCEVLAPVQERIPEQVRNTYWKRASATMVTGMREAYNQAELVGVLENAGYPYVIIKGEASQAYYANPSARQMGDVDFLVPAQYTTAIAEKMQQLGYTYTAEPGMHHQILDRPKARLEMHLELAGMPQGAARQPVEAFLADIYDRSVYRDLGAGQFRAPCDAHHAVVLLLHMQHHMMEQGMGLRHLIDWACYVNRTAEDAFWQQELLPALEKTGLKRFASVMTKTAAMYLQTACPQWAAQVEENLCRAVMGDILTGGHFGKKDAERARSSQMLPDWEKEKKESRWKRLYASLKKTVLKQRPELKGRPVALFFRMAGKAIRYVWLFLQGKRPNLVKAATHVQQRKSVYERLELFKVK